MLEYMLTFGQLSETEKTEQIHKSLLQSITHDKYSHITHTVAGLDFNFSWKGVSLCPKAFAALHSISYHKLTTVVEKIASTSEDEMIVNKFKEYTENSNNEANQIINFIKFFSFYYGYSTADTNNIVWLRDVALKSDIYDLLCEDFKQSNHKPPTLPYFYHVWKQHVPNIIPEGLIVVCSTCIKLHAEIDSSDPERSSIAVEQLNAHMAKQKTLREFYERLRVLARTDPKILVLIGDHMRSKFLPKFTQQTQQSLMTVLFEFAVSGWYNCRTTHTEYYLFGEHFKESSDTIISCLHQYLKDKHNEQQEHLYLIFDRHSTQANNLLMGYLEWLVRFAKKFKTITVIFLESGHTKTILDAEHKNIAQVYYSHEIFSIQEYVQLIASKTLRHTACWFQRLYNFNKLFEKVLQPIPDLQAAHILEITAEGTRTKMHPDEPFSEWRKLTAAPNSAPIEPFFFLTSAPSGDLVSLQPHQSAIDGIKAKAAKILALLTAVPMERTAFLRQVLAGDLGYNLDYKETWAAELHQQSYQAPTESQQLEVTKDVTEKEEQEWLVISVFKRKFALNDDNTVVCMFQAEYLDNGATVVEWQARDKFTYETATGRETNKAYDTYEQGHKYTGSNQKPLRQLELSKQTLSEEQIKKYKLPKRCELEGPAKTRKHKRKGDEQQEKPPKKKQHK